MNRYSDEPAGTSRPDQPRPRDRKPPRLSRSVRAFSGLAAVLISVTLVTSVLIGMTTPADAQPASISSLDRSSAWPSTDRVV